jgi:hypothetical protein
LVWQFHLGLPHCVTLGTTLPQEAGVINELQVSDAIPVATHFLELCFLVVFVAHGVLSYLEKLVGYVERLLKRFKRFLRVWRNFWRKRE